MAHTILALATLPRNIEALTDGEIAALCEEPEFLIECTPLERELLARLGASLEVHSIIENESQAEIYRLSQYEHEGMTRPCRESPSEALWGLVAKMEKSPGVNVRIRK